MKTGTTRVLAALMTLILALYPISTMATVPIRGSSGNGDDTSVISWNLFGPTELISFSGLQMRMQVRCDISGLNFDTVEASLGNSATPAKLGGCDAGNYIFLFQIQSGPKNLKITFSNLVNFTFNDTTKPFTVGVMECDAANTASLCTTTGNLTEPNITFKSENNAEVTFLIPNIPAFPAASCDPTVNICHQGQGLTLFLAMTPASPPTSTVPIAFPTIKVK